MTNKNKIEYDYEPLLDEWNDYQFNKTVFHQETTKMRRDIEQDAGDFSNEYYVWYSIEEAGIKIIFDNEYKLLTDSKTYFYGCSFEIYKLTYNERLNSFLSDYIDASEINFIARELNNEIQYELIDYKTYRKINYSIDLRNEFLNDKKTQLTAQPKLLENSKTNSLTWQGTPTEFIELSKALILNGSITGTGNQEDKINQLASFLNFEINNPYKLLNDIKTTRNNGSETLFLDKLKKTFFNYITLEKKK